ncbi:hypothetical protein [Cetobacterium sp.]|uniref:hypothetical protein n=1 Tax=Cetobacterium sp. TaxID=2071632 RepID=UPI003F35FB20
MLITKIFKKIPLDSEVILILEDIQKPYKNLVEIDKINNENLESVIYVGDNGSLYNKSGKELGSINGSGYITVRLKMADGTNKTFKRNRIVAETFLEDYQENLLVDHINGIKIDDRVKNIRMVNHSDNLSNKLKLDKESEINRLVFLKLEYLRNLKRIDDKIEKLKLEAI